MTNTELIRAAGFSANYFYIRLRGEAPFNTNDIERLAEALDVEPHEVLQLAESPELALSGDSERIERVDGVELDRRLRFLASDLTTPEGRAFDLADLEGFARERGADVTAEAWGGLLGQSGTVRVSSRLLDVLTEYFAVDARYLRAMRDSDFAELVEAEIALHRALMATGATAVSARALGGMSARQLEAITRAIRSIEVAPKHSGSEACAA